MMGLTWMIAFVEEEATRARGSAEGCRFNSRQPKNAGLVEAYDRAEAEYEDRADTFDAIAAMLTQQAADLETLRLSFKSLTDEKDRRSAEAAHAYAEIQRLMKLIRAEAAETYE
jgi:hypothetical protein